ncbi:MAG TPA: hypothetical protein VK699_13045, partial [Terriglobales bacterium]|nr:hypothetical protein [Terriglobales bacterium]
FESVQGVGTVTLNLYKNGLLIESVQDSSSPLNGGSPGMGVYGNTSVSVVNNFVGGKLITRPDILLASGAATWQAGDTIKLSVSGTALTLYQNSILLGTASDTSLLAGSPGILAVAGGALKNWSAANLSGHTVESLSALTSNSNAHYEHDDFQRSSGTFPQTLGSKWKNLWGPTNPNGTRAGGFSQIITSGTVGVNPAGVTGSGGVCGDGSSDDAPLWEPNPPTALPADQWSQVTIATSARPTCPSPPCSDNRITIGVVFRTTDNGDGTASQYTYVDSLGDPSVTYPWSTPRFIAWNSQGLPLVQKGGPAFQPDDVVLGIALGDVLYGYVNGILDLQSRIDPQYSLSGPLAGINDFNCYNFNSGDHRMTSWSAGSVP